VHTSTGEAEAGGSPVKASLGYIGRFSLRQINQKIPKTTRKECKQHGFGMVAREYRYCATLTFIIISPVFFSAFVLPMWHLLT
jgi:hypothetical protein